MTERADRAASRVLRTPELSKASKTEAGLALTQRVRHNRSKAYTYNGIGRARCVRCGSRASQQWSLAACAGASKTRWLALCDSCDVKLNRTVLRFLKFPDWRKMIEDYQADR